MTELADLPTKSEYASTHPLPKTSEGKATLFRNGKVFSFSAAL
jgi:hypothetical protein